AIADEHPDIVFIGGDILPHGFSSLSPFDEHQNFIHDFLVPEFLKLRHTLRETYPRVLLILGNDDSRMEEAAVEDAAAQGVWEYIHNRRVDIGAYQFYGYAYVPPTPFLLKDWERYDVSRYVDPGCVSPEEGWRTVEVSEQEKKYSTIKEDIELLAGDANMEHAVFLFHTPPHKTHLDRAGLDGKKVEHVPMDVHVGSIAVRRFIESRQPLLTLHGHIHESARLTGFWKDTIGRTQMFSAAHDGPELALVRFSLENLAEATRQLI
ncbi:metallophosphoesterase, partial [bacterium]|nr:metallophosphoesterase [bacterium]